MSLRSVLVFTALFCAPPALAQQLLKSEPASGELRQGAVVYVDDGTCPKGQVKMVKAGKGVPGDPAGRKREKSCVRRP